MSNDRGLDDRGGAGGWAVHGGGTRGGAGGDGDPHPANGASAQTASVRIPRRLTLAHHAELDRREVQRAILKHLTEVCKQKGIQVPADAADFAERAQVFFHGPANADGSRDPVPLDSVMITWEEG